MSDLIDVPDEAVEACMTAMGCKMREDAGECPWCADGYCRGHGKFNYCEAHDWHEDGHTTTTCGYARMVLAAALPVLRAQIEAETREKLTAEITARRGDVDPDEPRLYERGIAYGLSVAANLARGGETR